MKTNNFICFLLGIVALFIVLIYLKRNNMNKVKEAFKNYNTKSTHKPTKCKYRYKYKHRKLKDINGVKSGPNWPYKNKTLAFNPYYNPKKTLKQMFAHMAYDTLHGQFKEGPTLIDLSCIKNIKIPKIRLPPIINV